MQKKHTVLELAEDVREGRLSSKEAARVALDTLKQNNDQTGAILDFREHVLEEEDRQGPLAGVPVVLKDNMAICGEKMTCGSRMLANYRSPFDSEVYERLRDAGAFVVGKANMDEFSMGSTGTWSAFVPVINVMEPERIPGGSSSGSAAAVAMGAVPLALGTDSGGGVRVPAAAMGLAGFKPSYGHISRYGVVATANSLDTVGIIANNAIDCALTYGVLAGPSTLDATAVLEDKSVLPEWVQTGAVKELKGLRIAIPQWVQDQGEDPVVERGLWQLKEWLANRGILVETVDMPYQSYGLAAYFALAQGEGSGSTARYDGLRYGHRTAHYDSIDEMYVASRSEALGMEVKRRILMGAHVLSLAAVEETYGQAQKVRRLIAEELDHVFAEYDAVLLPTMMTLPHAVDEVKTLSELYALNATTVLANLAGIPAITLPMPAMGDVVGMQLMMQQHRDLDLLWLAHTVEEVIKDEL